MSGLGLTEEISWPQFEKKVEGKAMKRKGTKMERGVEKYYRWLRRRAYQIWLAQIKATEKAIGGELHAC
jgi:hypothetical protein